ncbi:MAG TPA: response regulator [Verrucomicrobiae bacterium]|jgi:CheY-like chemotaxis protein|nr:response regulator [Verrucomicrobiae bacterium]
MQKPILLLVEDSEDDAFIFRWTFEKSGSDLDVCHVTNGAQAIEYLSKAGGPEGLPRIVLLDLKMPQLNGFDVLSWMKEQTFSCPVPVVVVSGSDQEEDRERARSLGAAAYFVKPVTVADLQRIFDYIPAGRKDSGLAGTGAHI